VHQPAQLEGHLPAVAPQPLGVRPQQPSVVLLRVEQGASYERQGRHRGAFFDRAQGHVGGGPFLGLEGPPQGTSEERPEQFDPALVRRDLPDRRVPTSVVGVKCGWAYVERVEAQAQPEPEPERRATAGEGQRFVLPLRVEDPTLAAETFLPPDKCL